MKIKIISIPTNNSNLRNASKWHKGAYGVNLNIPYFINPDDPPYVRPQSISRNEILPETQVFAERTIIPEIAPYIEKYVPEELAPVNLQSLVDTIDKSHPRNGRPMPDFSLPSSRYSDLLTQASNIVRKSSPLINQLNKSLENAHLPISYDATYNSDGQLGMIPMATTNLYKSKYEGETPNHTQIGPASFAKKTDLINNSQSVSEETLGGEKDKPSAFNFNIEDLRYIPALGSVLGSLVSGMQPIDYTLPNRLKRLAASYTPMAAPTIGGKRRYDSYDINLGDAENLALQAAQLRGNTGLNPVTQRALNIASILANQKVNAARNLEFQKALAGNRLATDQYNLGIDQANANLEQAYDRYNQDTLNHKINMLAQAAQAEDATRTQWSSIFSNNLTNAFNQIGNLGRDEWAFNRANDLLPHLKS